MFFTQGQALLNLLYLFLNEPVICLLDILVHNVVVGQMAEIKQIMEVLFVLEIGKIGFYHRPLLEDFDEFWQFALFDPLEAFAEKIFLWVARSAGDRLYNRDLLVVESQEHYELPCHLEPDIVNLQDKLTQLLDVEGSNYLSEK